MDQILLSAVALGLLWAVMTIGVYVSYRILDIADLTAEGTLTLGAAVCISLIKGGANPVTATLAAFAAGLMAGGVTGLVHTKLKIPALISGILTMIALWSVNLRVMGASNVSILRMPTAFTFVQDLGLSKYAAWIVVGGGLALLLTGALYWFFGTELGSALRATGNNPAMVRAQGVHTDSMIIIGLMLSNGLIGLSGALISQSQAFADIQMGTGAIIIGLASLIVGETLFGRRNFYIRLLSLVFGAIVYRVIIALVMEMGMEPNDLKLFTAVTVALALSAPKLKHSLRAFYKIRKGGRARA